MKIVSKRGPISKTRVPEKNQLNIKEVNLRSMLLKCRIALEKVLPTFPEKYNLEGDYPKGGNPEGGYREGGSPIGGNPKVDNH
jgi:hypothetical protein